MLPAAFAQDLPPDAQALQDAGRLSVAGPGAPPLAVDDPRWDAAAAARLSLHPQIAITPGSEPVPARTAELRAISDGQSIALRVQWQDPSPDHSDGGRTDHFADAVSVQFAHPEGDGVLPYIGMGEPGRPVTVWYWQAGRGAEHLMAHGFGSLEKTAGTAPEHDARHDGEGWTVVLRGPLADAPLPVALAVWDGAANQRNGDKRLSAWHLVHVPGAPVERERYGALLAQQKVDGDPDQGRRLFTAHGCIGCHRVPGGADVAVGPDLRLAGAHHWPGYLRRMIEDPSAFIVPGKGYGIPGADGTLQSLMPRQALDAEEIEHIIAWLAGLGEKGGVGK